jgi:hypothetical protein
MSGLSFSARDTVLTDTPTASATSFIVVLFFISGLSLPFWHYDFSLTFTLTLPKLLVI